MAKKVRAIVKLQIPAAEATPAPPVGPALGQHGVNIMNFVKEYNSRTGASKGTIVPVQVTIFEDRSFTFVTKTPPASELIKKAADVEKGSQEPLRASAGTVTKSQIREIARSKLPDLNAASEENAMRSVEGTARSMGIQVVEG